MYKFSRIEGTHFQTLPTELLAHICSFVPKIEASQNVRRVIQRKVEEIKDFEVILAEAKKNPEGTWLLNDTAEILFPATYCLPKYKYARKALSHRTNLSRVLRQDIDDLILLYDSAYLYVPPTRPGCIQGAWEHSHLTFNPNDHATHQIAYMREIIDDHTRNTSLDPEILDVWKKMVTGNW